MGDLPDAFHAACDQVRAGSFAVTNDEKLMLYALYKIAGGETMPTGTRPILDPVARAKWDAWAEFGQVYSSMQARQLYPQLVSKLAVRSMSSK